MGAPYEAIDEQLCRFCQGVILNVVCIGACDCSRGIKTQTTFRSAHSERQAAAFFGFLSGMFVSFF